MTNEESKVLSIMGDCLNGHPSPDSPEYDWSKIVSIAQRHQILGLIYRQCSFIEEVKKHKMEVIGQVVHQCKQYDQIKVIRDALANNKIDNVIVKGSKIAAFYPDANLRSMGDIDLLVRREDKKRALEIFTELGYSPSGSIDYEVHLQKNGVSFELHDHLVYEKETNDSKQISFFSNPWEHTVQSSDGMELEWEYHFAYIISHLQKHLCNEGVGIRQFFDIAVIMNRMNDSLDWNKVIGYLEQMSLLHFTEICCSFCKRWFNMSSPLPSIELSDSFFEEATSTIISNGVFGFDNPNNKNGRIIQGMRKKKGYSIKYLIGKTISSVLPSYASMKEIKRYSFLQGRPLLLPFAWIYRIVLFCCGKLRHQSIYVAFSEYEKRNSYLKKWGL